MIQSRTNAIFSIKMESVARFTGAVETAWRVNALLLAPAIVN